MVHSHRQSSDKHKNKEYKFPNQRINNKPNGWAAEKGLYFLPNNLVITIFRKVGKPVHVTLRDQIILYIESIEFLWMTLDISEIVKTHHKVKSYDNKTINPIIKVGSQNTRSLKDSKSHKIINTPEFLRFVNAVSPKF